MPKRTPAPKPGVTEITNEWGIYDPEKAGMQALFKRLGRPILQASPKKARNERRRAQRPERTAYGVGLAIDEARRRAGLAPQDDSFEAISQSPARAMRAALRQLTPPTSSAPAAEPHEAPAATPYHSAPSPAVPHEPASEAQLAPATVIAMPPPTPAPRKRAAKRSAKHALPEPLPASAEARSADGPTAALISDLPAAAPAAPELPAAQSVERPRVRRAPRSRQTAPPPAASSAAVAAPPAPQPLTVKPGPPAPSPRRPRGPVPLAAWAHAAHGAPVQPPRRVDPLGFWRGWFRMPAEVALVEYARGARIHRLLIESVEDQPTELF